MPAVSLSAAEPQHSAASAPSPTVPEHHGKAESADTRHTQTAGESPVTSRSGQIQHTRRYNQECSTVNTGLMTV